MTWEAAAALAQIIATIGVLVSLIYLAGQVRNENRVSAVSAKLASTRLLTDFIDQMIANPELMELMLRGRKGDALTEVERHRFGKMCLKAFWFFSAAHFQQRVQTLNADDWAEVQAVVRFWINGQGVRAWWNTTGRARFGGAFVKFIEAEIEKLATPEPTPAAPPT